MSGSFLMGGLASLAAGLTGFLACKLVGGPFLVSGLASFAGNLPLFFLCHGAEPTVAFA
jgi:hypothetical protein